MRFAATLTDFDETCSMWISGINVQTALLKFSLGCLKFQAQIKEVVKHDVYFVFCDSSLLQFFQKIFYTSFDKLTRRTSQVYSILNSVQLPMFKSICPFRETNQKRKTNDTNDELLFLSFVLHLSICEIESGLEISLWSSLRYVSKILRLNSQK